MSAAQTSQHFDPASLAPREGSTAARNCGRNAEPLSKLHLVSRLSELDQDLSQRYINDSARAEALKPQIESTARRLSQAPFAGADEYVEGRRGLFGRKLGSDNSPELGTDGDSSGLIPHSVRTRIDYYLQASAQNARQMPMHVMAILVGILIFAGALFVDYTIVSEFWTRALANEFLELPGSLADSVGFKSLQVLFAAILLGGLAFGRPLLKPLMGAAWSMDDTGWRKLTLRFALFFLAMAALNEVVWRTQSTDFWVSFKVFGILGITFLFAIAQTPLMRRHHLAPEDAPEEAPAEAGTERSAAPGED